MFNHASCGLAALSVLCAVSAHAQVRVDPNAIRPLPDARLQGHTPVARLVCNVDPAITRVTLTKGTGYGDLRVTAVVTNLGADAWRSGSEQQNVTVNVRNNGTGHDFGGVYRLGGAAAPGRPLGTISTPMIPRAVDGGEFAGEVVVRIGYDPDISIDANPCNNDANTANNVVTIDNGAIGAFMRSSDRTLVIDY